MRKIHLKPCGLFSLASWLVFFFLFFLPSLPSAEENETYVEGLVKEAISRRLYEKRDWQTLLHYKHSLIHGEESLIDDPRFFLSKDGKRDPRMEMEETIRAFFSTDTEDDKHPQCRFIARFNWLGKELDIKKGSLPEETCNGFNELIEAIKPSSAVLVFPVGHMNSPASMFGHTLLRIDSDSESKLLSYAVNYSATTDETNGLIFAAKGIFGFYEGYFSILPYYEKIKEYNNLENRDMWEYRLNLSKEEVMRVVEHMWELKDIYSYYYFFDENCSYNLLLVLEAGRPDVDLTGPLPPWVIPTDTVRAVKKAGMYGEVTVYRPSKATKIRSIESSTEPRYQDIARDMAYGRGGPEKADSEVKAGKDQIRTLDLAAEYLQYMYAKKKVAKDDYSKLYLKILSARSRLGKGEDYKIEAPLPPEAGHGSSRAALGVGIKKGAVYQSLLLRPAYHDPTDPDEGYPPGAAISFLDTEFRYNYTERKFSLERLTFLEIVSISQMGRFFKPVSWNINAAVVREEFLKREHRTVFELNGGPGLSAAVLSDGLIYGFIEPRIKVGGDLKDNYSLGAGISAGVIKPITGAWKARFQFKATSYEFGDKHRVRSAELNQRFTINADNAIKLDLKREGFSGFYSNDINISWNRYF